MENKVWKQDELRAAICKGLDLTFEKLLKTKLQNNGTFVFSKNGVITKVKARDLQQP